MEAAKEKTPEAPKTLCFLDAFNARRHKEIDEAEYIHQNLLHLLHTPGNLEHPYCAGKAEDDEESEWEKTDIELLEVDPFGYSIQSWVLKREAPRTPITDVTPFEAVFATFRTSNFSSLTLALERIPQYYYRDILKSLALRSLQKKRPDVLKLCLDHGFSYDDFWIDAARQFHNSGKFSEKHVETFKVLEASEFRKLWPRSTPRVRHPLW